MKYAVIESESLPELISEVNEYIKRGWEPLGGISVIHEPIGDNYFHYQSIIKRGEE